MKKHSAFSLIELSIVILIIGIIIAGVTQGSRLVRQFKLSTSKTITKSSPVASISGLLLWLEPTSDDSFIDSEVEDEALVSQWNDINPQSASKYYATASANQPTYSEDSGPNGLPSLYFDGAALNLTTDAAGQNNATISTTNNSFTFFLVYSLPQAITFNFHIINEAYAVPPSNQAILFNAGLFTYQIGSNNSRHIIGDPSSNVTDDLLSGVVAGSKEIVSSTFNGTTLNPYVNGSSDYNNSPFTVGSATDFTVGSTSSTSPIYISEIIIFNRNLKDKERHDVEAYLGKKYGIQVAVSSTPVVAVPSDITLKENIELIGKQNGFNIYEFNYKNDPHTRYSGVMAQEVLKVRPDAVSMKDGHLAVYYSKIGVDFKVVSRL